MIGTTQTLTVSRIVDFGVYLDSGNELGEILLPSRYITHPLKQGDTVRVFIYRDSEDRPVATTESPKAEVGQFAWLSVKQTNKVGAFLDWGLSKDILVPFREQKSRMIEGHSYPVYVYVDHNSGRIAATSKIEKYLGNLFPAYHPGDRAECMAYSISEIGVSVIVDNAHHGMLYSNELPRPLKLGEHVTAYIKHVRPDGKIDLTMTPPLAERLSPLEDLILEKLDSAGGTLAIGDKSSPEEIRRSLDCSKKDFKRAIGSLYKKHLVIPGDFNTRRC